jgi:hypothetical protein
MRTIDELRTALLVLRKWRTVFAGWQLGTRPVGDPECDAVRDHRELSMILRAEQSAIIRLLIEKNICTREEWAHTLCEEAILLDQQYETRFPGFKASEIGITIDPRGHELLRKWRP